MSLRIFGFWVLVAGVSGALIRLDFGLCGLREWAGE